MNHTAGGDALTILVIEDDDLTLAALTMQLERMSHVIRGASSVKTAVRSLQDQYCDMILCDIGLPDGCGWDLLKMVPASAYGFAIAMSGYGAPADLRKSLESGFICHLCKPFGSKELKSAMAVGRDLLNKQAV